MSGLLALLLLAVPARAADEAPVADAALPRPPRDRPGWAATGSSLLLYDSSGTLVDEVGLGRWEEDLGSGVARRRTVTGGASKDGRFAWSWEKAESLKPGVSRNDKPGASTRLMRYLGTNGAELFRDELADAPPGLPPVFQSADGEAALVAERGPDGWILEAYSFAGNRLLGVHEPGSVEAVELTPHGRFAAVRWHQLDQPPVYTFLDLEKRTKRTVASGQFPPGFSVRVEEDGRVFAGKKSVLSLR